MRRRANLGHWAAFQRSFRRLAELVTRAAAGELGSAPRSIVLLSGDVHHCYLAEVELARGDAEAPVWQAVCSGMRKALAPSELAAIKVTGTRPFELVSRAVARAGGVPPPPVAWRVVEGPVYANQIATLTLDGAEAELSVETTAGADWRYPGLRPAFSHRLASA